MSESEDSPKYPEQCPPLPKLKSLYRHQLIGKWTKHRCSLFICISQPVSLSPLVAVFELWRCSSLSGGSSGRCAVSQPSHQGATQLQLLGGVCSKSSLVNANANNHLKGEVFGCTRVFRFITYVCVSTPNTARDYNIHQTTIQVFFFFVRNCSERQRSSPRSSRAQFEC